LVSANLYVPAHLDGPAPCALGTCGHSALGKATPLYQAFCQRLVASGFVVLIYDPLSQGERDQYLGLSDKEAAQRVSRDHNTAAHNMMGKQLELVGEYLGMWRAWDGIRGLDYLLSRPEVDPGRVGLTGNSGGGTMTTWLWAIEDRFSMAAPSCFVTTFLNNLENELPADCEQYPPGVLAHGLEMVDFLLAQAPKPVLLLGQHYDFFDRRGHQEACDEVHRIYQLLGAPEGQCGCYRGPHGHGFYVENQEAMVAFFAHHAGVGVTPLSETEVLPEEQLWATPTGQVLKAGSRPIYALVAEKARKLQAERPRLGGADLETRLRELLTLPPRRGAPHYRVLRPTRIGEWVYGRYAVETERGIRAILRKKMADPEIARSLDVSGPVHLFVPHCASEEDLQSDPLALDLQAEGELYALDVRGLGESMPDEEGGFWQVYGLDYMFHGHSLMFSESYLGRRVHDLLRTIDLLVAQGASRIELYGRGQGALLALFAACLHPAVAHVTLKNGPASYGEWAQAPLVAWPSANMVRGVLQHLDLDDCVEALGERVTVVEPWSVDMRSKEQG
ncbi:MAG: prolyl oligopeptidase family serine peptidase, partial [Anaerolineae bacterium]|nr:prolyl oligopeptidase family serine peptidase [Anaerolineae bacterium]